MSKVASTEKRKSILDFQKMKDSNQKISMITCYDSSFAKLVAQSQVDSILVGDSLGNVMLGNDDTLSVTLDDMIHHTRSVARVVKNKFICTDMPFGTYQSSLYQAVDNAVRLVKEGQAHSVKIEGGIEVADKIEAISNAGIPVVAHLGLTPQSVHKLGGYRVQGKNDEAAKQLIADAVAVEKAGASMLVLELVPASVAETITEQLNIPTIGIGAGNSCSGQVLVLQDMLGFESEFNPKFLKRYMNLGTMAIDALNQYNSDVKECSFPTEKNSY